MNYDQSNIQPENSVNPPVVVQKTSRNHPIISIILVAALLIVGLAYSLTRQDKPTNTAKDTPLTADVAQASAQISITAEGFSPATIKISQGTTVTWTNTDTAAHNLKSDVPGLETEEPLNSGDQFSLMFETLGTFTISDTERPEFKCVVEVE